MIKSDAVEEKVEVFTDFEDRCTLFDSFILCRFFRDLYPWEELSKLLFLTTGLSYDQKELSSIAGKIKDNTRFFNLREGLTAQDDTLSPRLYDNKLEGEKGISKNELQKLVLEYYKIRGWDAKGIPQQSEQTIKAKQAIKETEPK
jgi:aldehyde:ferredoxin oxidoreductase